MPDGRFAYMSMGGRGVRTSYTPMDPAPPQTTPIYPPDPDFPELGRPDFSNPDFPDLADYKDKAGAAKEFWDNVRDIWDEINRDRGGGYIPPDVNVGWGTPSPGLPPGGSGMPGAGIIIPPLIPPFFGGRPTALPPAKDAQLEAPDEGYEILRSPWRPIPFYIDANWMSGSLFGGYNNGFGTIGGAFIE